MTWGKDSASRAREPFEDGWPDLARGLDNALRARRVPATRREDIIQETGLRLFRKWNQLDPERPVWPFALTIAINLLKDEQRMQARRTATPHQVEEVVERGVEEEALARLELIDVQAALQKLTPAQRSVLLADLGQLPYDDRAPAALKMLRMRARRTLRSVIDRASALVPLAGGKVRDAFNSVAVNLQRSAVAEQAQLVVLSTLGIAGAASILGAALGVTSGGGTWSNGRDADVAPRMMTAASVDGSHSSAGAGRRAAPLDGPVLAGARSLRSGVASHQRHRPRRPNGPGAVLDAGGTGIDDEPSLRSRSWRVWVFARAAASGHEALVDYEVEQRNPVCGSPTGSSSSATRSCLRAEAPRVRGEASLGKHSTAGISTR
jgi:RNA polymerase sigma factor (sigma-70 family)